MRVNAIACLGFVCALPLAAQENLGIYQNTATAFEHGDAGRSHTFGEAIFAEDMSETADYSVEVREAMGRYPGAYNIVTRAPDEIFVYYSVYGDVDASTGPTVAKLNSDTLEEVWNTQIAAFGDEKWNYPGVLSLHGNGRLYAVGGEILAMLDPDTGAVLRQTELPSAKPSDVSYNGFITTSDGTLFTKPLYRTCPERGGQALLKCPDAETPTVLIAIDPETLDVLAEVPVKEAVFGRLIVGTHEGADFVYMQGAESLFRYGWDGETLAFDDAWGSVSVLADGQIAAASPNVGTDWVFFQTNGAPSEVPMSVWAVSTRDSSVRHTIQPFADLSFDKSFNFSMGTYDPVNSRVYIADAGAGYLAGLSFDPETGFDRLWQEDQTTFGYTMIVGPPEERVFVATNVTGAGSRINPLLARREEVLFRDADDGRLLAQTERLDRMSLGANLVAGYEGRFYYLSEDGRLLEISIN